MPLIGGTVYENPPEEELAAGVMELSKLKDIYGSMKAVMNDSKRRDSLLMAPAAQKHLDEKWFMTQSITLLRMLDAAVQMNAKAAIGFYE